MCGRNSLFNPQPELEERFDAEDREPIRPRYVHRLTAQANELDSVDFSPFSTGEI